MKRPMPGMPGEPEVRPVRTPHKRPNRFRRRVHVHTLDPNAAICIQRPHNGTDRGTIVILRTQDGEFYQFRSTGFVTFREEKGI